MSITLVVNTKEDFSKKITAGKTRLVLFEPVERTAPYVAAWGIQSFKDNRITAKYAHQIPPNRITGIKQVKDGETFPVETEIGGVYTDEQAEHLCRGERCPINRFADMIRYRSQPSHDWDYAGESKD